MFKIIVIRHIKIYIFVGMNKNRQKKLSTPGNLGCKNAGENVVYSWQGSLVCGQGCLVKVAWDLRESHHGP